MGVKPSQHSEISGFTWDPVNQKKGEFVRGEGLERISTNGVESPFDHGEILQVSGVTMSMTNDMPFILMNYCGASASLSS